MNAKQAIDRGFQRPPFKRFDMRTILKDPAMRREMIARGTVATMAREGIDISYEEALAAYDAMKQDKRWHRLR